MDNTISSAHIESDLVTSTPIFHRDLISSWWCQLLFRILYYLLIFSAAISNVLALIAICSRAVVRCQPTYLYICNLCLSDLTRCLVSVPLELWEFKEGYNHGDLITDTFCRWMCAVKFLPPACAILTVIAISVDRLLLICYPIYARVVCTPSRAKKILALTWLLACLSLIPLLLPTGLHYPAQVTILLEEGQLSELPFKTNTMRWNSSISNSTQTFNTGQTRICFIYNPTSSEYSPYSWYITIICFVFPLSFVGGIYIKIFYTLHYDTSLVMATQDESYQRVVNKRRRVSRMMLLIAVFYAITNGPFIFYMLRPRDEIEDNFIFFFLLTHLVSILPSCFNPIIYTFHSHTLRLAICTSCRHLRHKHFKALFTHSASTDGETEYC